MKEKYLSPYSANTAAQEPPRLFTEIYARTSLIGKDYAFAYKMNLDENYGVCPTSAINVKRIRKFSERFTSLEDAKNYLDKILLNEGYVFLTQEQWDKLSILI